MNKLPRWPLLFTFFVIFACDGPHEEAGERADVAAGDSGTVASLKSGPRERAGEMLDRIEQARTSGR